jgi:hypothetical protein
MNTNERQAKFRGPDRQFLNPVITTINNQTASFLGNGMWGLPLVPQSFKTFRSNVDDINRLNTFEKNFENFKKNQLLYQGNILPYLTAYSVLQNQGQINFTRLVGLNLPDFPLLKPGFSLDNSYNIYVMTMNITKNNNFLNFWNYDIPTSFQNDNYYQAIIITKNCNATITNVSNNTFQLNLVSTDLNLRKFNNIDIPIPAQKFNQVKVYNKTTDLPPAKITFNFNQFEDNLFWKNVLNTNIHRLDDFGYAIVHYTDIFNKIYFDSQHTTINSITLTQLNNNNFKNFQEEAHAAASPWVVSQGFYTLNQFTSRNDDGLKLQDRVLKLFKIHAMCPGELGNNLIIKIIPVSLAESEGWARFHLHLVDKTTENTIYEFNNLDLNPDSVNFIGRVIGTEKVSVDLLNKKIYADYTMYRQQNPWIRVELADAVLNYAIPHNTLPSGYLGVNKLKNNLNNNLYRVLNNSYTISPQFDLTGNITNAFASKLNLFPTHAWGKNLKNISFKNALHISDNQNIFKLNDVATITKTSKMNESIQLVKYENKKLTANRSIELKNYLNTNFYDINDDNYDEMFHLEKILLLNVYNTNTNQFRQLWNYAKYIQQGTNINTLKLANKFYPIFDNSNNLENIYYYFTINDKAFIKNSDNLDGVDSIEEAKIFDDNILNFNMEMFGGWDGLNLLDINEYSINDKGLNQSQYLRELYKIGLEIIKEESNGQNELIYLPEIFNQNVIDYAIDLFSDTTQNLLILDKPFYDINSNIIYSKDILQLDTGTDGLQYNWYDQKYKYPTSVDGRTFINNLQFDFDTTISNWSQLNRQLSNVSSFGNYFEMLLPAGAISQINLGINYDITFIIPSGLVALNALINRDRLNRKMNPLHNSDLLSLDDLKIIGMLDISLEETNNPNYHLNLKKINNLNINLIYKSKGASTLSFFSDKTNLFDNANNSILTRINVRNTLNDIKKKIKLASYALLFNNISSKANITAQFNALYHVILTQYVNNRLISNFKIVLDETTTSDEDILMGLVRGSIYLQFNNQEIVQIPV